MNLPVQPELQGIAEEELAAVMQPIARATGMPNAAYTDQAAFEFERDYLLARHWTAIAFIDHLQQSSVKPIDFMGLPILVTRDKANEVRVFHNVCSHRGMKLVNAERKTNGLVVCPYHSWTYSIDGELKATPNIGGVGVNQLDEFTCANNGLKAIRSYIWMGILFINLDNHAEEFDVAASDLISRYKKLMGKDAEQQLVKGGEDSDLTMDLKCNWKLAIENYLEAYHLPVIHPSLNSYSPLGKHTPEIFADIASGQVTSTFDPGHDKDAPLPLLPEWDPERVSTGEYPALYPNLLLGIQANHMFAMIIIPLSPEDCREQLSIFYVGDAATSEEYRIQRKDNMDAWTIVFGEDIEPCERMQTGRRSPGFSGGAFSPVLDRCSHHFHQWVARHYMDA